MLAGQAGQIFTERNQQHVGHLGGTINTRLYITDTRWACHLAITAHLPKEYNAFCFFFMSEHVAYYCEDKNCYADVIRSWVQTISQEIRRYIATMQVNRTHLILQSSKSKHPNRHLWRSIQKTPDMTLHSITLYWRMINHSCMLAFYSLYYIVRVLQNYISIRHSLINFLLLQK